MRDSTRKRGASPPYKTLVERACSTTHRRKSGSQQGANTSEPGSWGPADARDAPAAVNKIAAIGPGAATRIDEVATRLDAVGRGAP